MTINELPPLFGDDFGTVQDDLPLLEQSTPSSAGSDEFVDDAEERWNALQASMDENEIASVVKSIKDITSYDFADLVRMMEERKRSRSEIESAKRKLLSSFSSDDTPVAAPNLQYTEAREPNLTISAGDDTVLRNQNLKSIASPQLHHTRIRNWNVLRNLRRSLAPSPNDDVGLNTDKVSLMEEQRGADTARMRLTVLDSQPSERSVDRTPPISPTMFNRPDTDHLDPSSANICKPVAGTSNRATNAPVKKSDWRTFKIEKGLTCAQPTCSLEMPGVNDYTFDIWNTSPNENENGVGEEETFTMLSEEESALLHDDIGQLSLQETLTQNDEDDDDDAFMDIPLENTHVLGIQSFNSLLHYDNEEEEELQMRTKAADVQPQNTKDNDVDIDGRNSPTAAHDHTTYVPSKAAAPSVDESKPARPRPVSSVGTVLGKCKFEVIFLTECFLYWMFRDEWESQDLGVTPSGCRCLSLFRTTQIKCVAQCLRKSHRTLLGTTRPFRLRRPTRFIRFLHPLWKEGTFGRISMHLVRHRELRPGAAHTSLCSCHRLFNRILTSCWERVRGQPLWGLVRRRPFQLPLCWTRTFVVHFHKDQAVTPHLDIGKAYDHHDQHQEVHLQIGGRRFVGIDLFAKFDVVHV